MSVDKLHLKNIYLKRIITYKAKLNSLSKTMQCVIVKRRDNSQKHQLRVCYAYANHGTTKRSHLMAMPNFHPPPSMFNCRGHFQLPYKYWYKEESLKS